MGINNIEFLQIGSLNRRRAEIKNVDMPEWVKPLVFTRGVSDSGNGVDGYRLPSMPKMFIPEEYNPITVTVLPDNISILEMEGRPSSAFADFSSIVKKCDCFAYDPDVNSRFAIVSSTNGHGNIHECEKFTAKLVPFTFSDDAVILLRRIVGNFMYNGVLYVSKDRYYAIYKEGEKEPVEYIDFPKGRYGYL